MTFEHTTKLNSRIHYIQKEFTLILQLEGKNESFQIILCTIINYPTKVLQ